MADVIRVSSKEMPHAEILTPSLPLRRFSDADPVLIARNVIDLIDRSFSAREASGCSPFEDIILIGHSTGGLIARKVYLLSGPESDEARFEDSKPDSVLSSPRPWFGNIRRIVLFAAMNRGWSVSHHLNLRRAVIISAGLVFAEVVRLFTGRQFTILHTRRGARFITELRLQWIALTSRSPQVPLAVTIQLLGTVDDLVAPSDNVDLATGRDFIYLDVPFSGHDNVVRMDESIPGRMRRCKFVEALTEDPVALGSRSLVPEDSGMLEVRNKVTDVIFVIHGIRDVGYWTQKIARRVETIGNRKEPPRVYAAETSSYGYFAMIPFLLPWRRQEKVHWLMDQYVEAKALYPSARFTYMGHSNGTYLLARALRDYKACRFERVVFAGSVVRTDYDWETPLKRGQVEGILNYVATADWVVAFFPGALEIMDLPDLGSAGHNGFRFQSPALVDVRYVEGGHSAALAESNWDDIARFIVAPGIQAPPTPPPMQQADWVVFWGKRAPVIWAVLAAIFFIAIPSFCLYSSLCRHWLGPVTTTLLLVTYFWIVVKVLTRF